MQSHFSHSPAQFNGDNLCFSTSPPPPPPPTVALGGPSCSLPPCCDGPGNLLEESGGFNQVSFYSLFLFVRLFFQFSWLLPGVNCFLFFSSHFLKNINI
ncbi:UNVERIFIED_CONTAM: hypothetical protein K2H54_015330 [Gekko kuhli]